MLEHTSKYRVRYGDTDQMGYMYYGRYPFLYEIGRTEAMRSIGMAYSEMEKEHGVMMPVMDMNVRFVRPALYDDELTIVTAVRKLPEKYIKFHTEIFNRDDKLINGGTIKLCFVDALTKKVVSPPSYFLSKLKPHFE